jgi:type I restriction-modification system DNA methylase subunit
MNHKKVQSFIKKTNKEYTINEIIGSFVYCFKKINEISNLGFESQKFITHKNEKLVEYICSQFDIFSLKDLEVVFENIIDNERKKKEGVVYTPDYIIDYIIRHSIKTFKQKSNDIPIVCDPACGSGGFLIQAIDILSKEYNLSYIEAFHYIRGTDINSQSVQCAKILLEAFFGLKNIEPPKIDNLFTLDTLLTDTEEFLEIINCKNGIDILTTNPPYVKLQHLDHAYREQLLEKFSGYANGSFSTAILFLLVGYRLLSNNGVLGYITQNNFFTSLTGKNIRQYIQEQKALHTIIDFVHTKVFENASAYTCLIFLTKQPNDSFYFQWSLNPKKELSQLTLGEDLKLLTANLNSKKWRLAPKKHLENLYKIENVGKKLKEVADIRVGFATLKDSIFTFKNDLDIEEEITRPAIKIAEWNNEKDMKKNQLKIIFPYKKVNEKYIPIDEEEMKSKYPKAYSYLLQHKEELASRDKGKLNLKYFYEWGRTQAMEAEGPKLLTKTFSKGPNFMLDTTDSLFCNGYSVKPKDEKQMPILVLQKILNSIVMDYYTKVTSFQIEGNYQCFQKNFIEIFSVPDLSELERSTILGSNDIDSFLCELYNLDIEKLKEVVNR